MSGKERVPEGKIIPKRDKFNENVASGSPKRKRVSSEAKDNRKLHKRDNDNDSEDENELSRLFKTDNSIVKNSVLPLLHSNSNKHRDSASPVMAERTEKLPLAGFNDSRGKLGNNDEETM